MSQCYWILACETDSQKGREGTYSLLKSRVQDQKAVDFTAVFDVPLNLKFGRFDDLIRLADDLQKQDTFCENSCRRLERMALEIDPQAEFSIFWQRNSLTVEQYLSRFIWDDSKYPRNRLLKETVDLLIASVARLDEEVRVKSSLFTEIKQAASTTGKRDNLSIGQRDLIEILTPEIVEDSDFVFTDHLTTLVCLVPKVEISSFENNYATWAARVVPTTAKKFAVTDRDGTSVYRVIMFRDCLDEFKSNAKTNKIVTRDFLYSSSAYTLRQDERTRIEAEKSKQENVLSRICYAAFSECFIAWTHVKAIRIFVEATLRYGLPPKFSAYLIRVISKSKEARIRKELDSVLVEGKGIGRQYHTSTAGKADSQAGNVIAGVDLDDDYYGYVSLELQPFVQAGEARH